MIKYSCHRTCALFEKHYNNGRHVNYLGPRTVHYNKNGLAKRIIVTKRIQVGRYGRCPPFFHIDGISFNKTDWIEKVKEMSTKKRYENIIQYYGDR